LGANLGIPECLIDYFKDWLLVVDEFTFQRRKFGMYNGDQAQKVLIEHGFRLPSADNRPLKAEEFW